jgi:heavy metal sensor kinase
MITQSLRFRLTVWHAAVLTVVFTALGIVFFVQLKTFLEDTLLDDLLRRARQIGSTLVADVPRTGKERLARAVEDLYAPEKGDRFIRITGADGSILYLSGRPMGGGFDPAAVPPIGSWPAAESVRNERLPGGAGILVAACRVTPGPVSYLIEVGTSAEPAEALLRRLAILLGIGLPVVIAVAVGGGYLLVRRALRPVDEIAGKAEVITQHNLGERLPVSHTGDEIERLAVALNLMITRLEDAVRISKRFVVDASHELRTPLTILRGELESLAQGPSAAGELADRLGSLLEEVERLTKIVERLFALSRLDAGEAQAEWTRFDLAEMTVSTADQMRLLADDKRIAITCEAPDPVLVEGDRARLKQVVVNLLDNAVKYTPAGGSISLKVAARGGRAVLEVADSGMGISEEALPHIFERFYRADRSRSRETEGAGLGLAIVKSICNAHGGELQVESAPGRGSRFRVRLALAA